MHIHDRACKLSKTWFKKRAIVHGMRSPPLPSHLTNRGSYDLRRDPPRSSFSSCNIRLLPPVRTQQFHNNHRKD